MAREASRLTAAVRGDVDGVKDRAHAGGEAAPVAAVMEPAGADEEDVARGGGRCSARTGPGGGARALIWDGSGDGGGKRVLRT